MQFKATSNDPGRGMMANRNTVLHSQTGPLEATAYTESDVHTEKDYNDHPSCMRLTKSSCTAAQDQVLRLGKQKAVHSPEDDLTRWRTSRSPLRSVQYARRNSQNVRLPDERMLQYQSSSGEQTQVG